MSEDRGVLVMFPDGPRKVVPAAYERDELDTRSCTILKPVFDLPGWTVEEIMGTVDGCQFIATRTG